MDNPFEMSLVESFIQKHARKELNDIRIIHEKHKDSYNKLKRQYEETKDVYERSSKKLKQAETNARMLGIAIRSENLSCINYRSHTNRTLVSNVLRIPNRKSPKYKSDKKASILTWPNSNFRTSK